MSVDGLNEMDGRLLVTFDGRCGFCNGAVRWFLRRDRRDRLRFVPFESPKVAGVLGRAENLPAFLQNHLTSASLPSGSLVPSALIVVRSEASGPAGSKGTAQVLVRSDAALAMLGALSWPWPAFAAALRWIPRPLRDLGYRMVAGARYRLGGRLTSCPVPTAEERARFL